MKEPIDNIDIIDIEEDDIEIIDIGEPKKSKNLFNRPPEDKEATKKTDRIAIISFLVIIVLLILFAVFGKKIIGFVSDFTSPKQQVVKPTPTPNPAPNEGTVIDKNSLDSAMVKKMENMMRVALLEKEQFSTSVSNMNLLYNQTKLGMVYQTLTEDLFVRTNCSLGSADCIYSISAAVFQKQATKVLGTTVSITQEAVNFNNNVLGICANLTYNSGTNEYETNALCSTTPITTPLQGEGILVDFYEYKKNGDELTVSMKYLYRKVGQVENEYQYQYYTSQTDTMALFGPLTTETGTDQTTVETAKMKEYRDNLDGLKFTFKLNDNNTFQLLKIQKNN